jgi:predicted kinase
MRPKLTMCKGLPGSGTTTWAMEQVAAFRVNQDDIRKELGWTSWATWDFKSELEHKVHDLKKQRIAAGLQLGRDVISDDTNLDR